MALAVFDLLRRKRQMIS